MSQPFAIGIDIGGTKIACALVDREGTIHAESVTATFSDKGDIIAQITKGVHALNVNLSDVAGIGVGSPGQVDAKAGIVRYSVNLNWHDFPLRQALSDALKLPESAVIVENDARAALRGEWWCGAAKHTQNAVMLSVGTGLGCAGLVDGVLVQGSAAFAFEVGQIITSDGDLFERAASGKGLARFGDTHSLLESARQGDQDALNAVQSLTDPLAEAALWLCSILNPECLIIGGGMGLAAADFLIPALCDTLLRRASPPVKNSVRVVPAEVTNAALGCAALVWAAER